MENDGAVAWKKWKIVMTFGVIGHERLVYLEIPDSFAFEKPRISTDASPEFAAIWISSDKSIYRKHAWIVWWLNVE